jgi:hypothetical protein
MKSKTRGYTSSGLLFDIGSFSPDSVRVTDIVHSLVNMPRYNGHLPFFYSNGEHSLLAHALAPQGVKLNALIHDFAEAFTGDLPHYLKAYLRGVYGVGHVISNLEASIDRAIHIALDIPHIPYGEEAAVKRADKLTRLWDIANLFPTSLYGGGENAFNLVQEYEETARELKPTDKELLILERHSVRGYGAREVVASEILSLLQYYGVYVE